MKITRKSLTVHITNIYRNVQIPVVFQKILLNNQQKDNNTFDHADVKNLWIELSGRRYSEESLDLG
jgi:hypothetical protein